MALHDRAFLDKIEQFLLHPTVRALSLAQRVDFLEQKGLSPEEITQCLKSVQAHNGLSQLVQSPASGALAAAALAAKTAANGGAVASGAASKLSALTRMTRKYGVPALILSLLGVGYARFRQRVTEQLVVEYQAERLRRRAKRNVQVDALLSVIQDQQAQYKQTAMLLQRRVTKVAKMQKDALAQQSAASAGAVEMRKRHEEVHSLKSTLLQLKSEVLSAFIKPTSPSSTTSMDHTNDNTEATSEKPSSTPTSTIAVQVVSATTAKLCETVAVQTEGPANAPLGLPLVLNTSRAVDPPKPVNHRISAPTLVSRPVNVLDLVGGQNDCDELSTSQSYHVLLATS